MTFYEKVSGARLHAAYIRPGGVQQDLPLFFLDELGRFSSLFFDRLIEISSLLAKNRIWRQRLLNVGIASSKFSQSFGFSGVLLRSTGVKWDLRKATPYELYADFMFEIPFSSLGDSYSRYLLRVEELVQSNVLI